MHSPAIYPTQLASAFLPIYPLTQGLSSKMISTNITQALHLLDRTGGNYRRHLN